MVSSYLNCGYLQCILKIIYFCPFINYNLLTVVRWTKWVLQKNYSEAAYGFNADSNYKFYQQQIFSLNIYTSISSNNSLVISKLLFEEILFTDDGSVLMNFLFHLLKWW